MLAAVSVTVDGGKGNALNVGGKAHLAKKLKNRGDGHGLAGILDCVYRRNASLHRRTGCSRGEHRKGVVGPRAGCATGQYSDAGGDLRCVPFHRLQFLGAKVLKVATERASMIHHSEEYFIPPHMEFSMRVE
jgi:hypothetical protein